MSSSTNAGEWNDWNAPVIAEFRANGGAVHGNFDGAPLHSTGAKIGKERINPMMYQDLGNGSIAVFASKAGADSHPDWYHNISAHPDVTAEIGTDTRRFRTRTATGDERALIWDKQKTDYPGFAEYEARTTRQIPSSSSIPPERRLGRAGTSEVDASVEWHAPRHAGEHHVPPGPSHLPNVLDCI